MFLNRTRICCGYYFNRDSIFFSSICYKIRKENTRKKNNVFLDIFWTLFGKVKNTYFYCLKYNEEE